MTCGVLNYSLNNNEFTEKYCENKAKPVMECNGKCKLAKLAKETENNNSDKNTVIEKETVLYFQSIEKIEFLVFLPKKTVLRQNVHFIIIILQDSTSIRQIIVFHFRKIKKLILNF